MIRAALWFVGLFALAVSIALFAGNNQGIVSLFWQPYRIDISLNVFLLALLVIFALGYAALRAFSALLMLPQHAKRWRQQQKERQIYQTFVESFSHLQAGRYVRASKSAQSLLKLSDELRHEHAKVPQDTTLRAIAHMFAADSAHALRNLEERDKYYALALDDVPLDGSPQQQEIREGAQMRAARWALDDRDPREALHRLEQLAPGAKRRTMALRIKLKAARLAQEVSTSLDTARLLYKHGGLSQDAANGMLRSLLQEQLHHTHDSSQVQQLWNNLPRAERQDVDIVLRFTQRWLHVGGDCTTARQWLLPLWEQFVQSPQQLHAAQTQHLLECLQQALEDLDADWLARIESAYRAAPYNAQLQYLAGMACMQRQLWGKAEQLLEQALLRLQEHALRAQAWKALAILAEQREDAAAAAHAWREAALQLTCTTPKTPHERTRV